MKLGSSEILPVTSDFGAAVCGIDPVRFLLFCEYLKIPAKDDPFGVPDPTILKALKLFRPQVYLFNEILEGLRKDIHLFWVVKCRQSGTTTLGLAFILYWCYQHPGMVFNMINPDTKLMAYNRRLLSWMAVDIAKNHPEWCEQVEENNVNLLSFANGSTIVWLNANSKEDGLSRGIGVIGTHGTELGEWKHPQAVRSWFAALSKRHPSRFFLLEGTSKGPGLFKDYWISYAEEEIGGKSIFIGWWLHPLYDLDLKDKTHLKIFNAYWKGCPRLTRDESVWWSVVKERYGYEISATQMAWWRYMWRKEYGGDLSMMHQEYPPIAEFAWQHGAKTFVNSASYLVQRANVHLAKDSRRYFKVEYGTKFDETNFIPVKDPEADYDLVLWDEPRVDDDLCRYIISMDPSHGANELSDLAVVQIFRAYCDKCVQVGEFAQKELPSYALAWIILELAGIYHCETRLCVELQGGGYSVSDELQRLVQESDRTYSPKLVKHFEKLQSYEFFKPDRRRRGSNTYHWVTSGSTKPIMLNRYRDCWERGILEIRSPELLKETRDTIMEGDGEIVPDRDDNRLMAASLGVMAWLQTVEYDIGTDDKFTKEASDAREAQEELGATPANLLSYRVADWKAGLLQRMEEEYAQRQALQEAAQDGDWRQNYEVDSQRKYYP